jgi:hypothetical protein
MCSSTKNDVHPEDQIPNRGPCPQEEHLTQRGQGKNHHRIQHSRKGGTGLAATRHATTGTKAELAKEPKHEAQHRPAKQAAERRDRAATGNTPRNAATGPAGRAQHRVSQRQCPEHTFSGNLNSGNSQDSKGEMKHLSITRTLGTSEPTELYAHPCLRGDQGSRPEVS